MRTRFGHILAVWATLAFLSSMVAGVAHATPVLPPNAAPKLQRALLLDRKPPPPLPAPWRITAINLDRSEIRIALGGDGGATGRVTLTPRTEPPPEGDDVWRRTRSFDVAVAPAPEDGPFSDAVTALVDRIAAGDDGAFFIEPERAPRNRAPEPEPEDEAPLPLELFAWLHLALLPLLLGAAAWRCRRDIPRPTAAQAAALAVITAAFGAVVAALPDAVVYHNGHGQLLIRVVSGIFPGVYTGEEMFPSDFSMVHVARVFGALAEPGHELMVGNRVAATLCLPASFLLGLTVLGRGRDALIATGLLAVQAPLIHAARSEYPSPQTLLLFVVSSWLAALAASSGRKTALAAAFVWIAALLFMRNEGFVLAFGAVGFYLAMRPRGRPRAAEVVAAAGVVALAVKRMLYLAPYGDPGQLAFDLLNDIFDQPIWVAPAMLVLALGGLVALVARGRWWLALILGGFGLGLVLITQIPADTLPNLTRYQMPALIPAVLAAGFGIAELLRRWPLVGGVGAAALAAWVALGSLTPAQTLANPDPEAQQLVAWRRLMAFVPRGATVMHPLTLRGRNDYRTGTPTVELKLARPDLKLVAYRDVAGGPYPKGPLVWVEPLHCALDVHQDGGPPPGECDQGHAEFHLQPWATTTIPTAPAGPARGGPWTTSIYRDEAIRIGFYLATPRRDPGRRPGDARPTPREP